MDGKIKEASRHQHVGSTDGYMGEARQEKRYSKKKATPQTLVFIFHMQ